MKTLTRNDSKAIIGLAAAPLILLGRFLFTWPTPLVYPTSSLGTDLPREIWPLAYFIKSTILTTGELPLWRSYLLSGAPIVGHPIAPIFYPPHWLTLLFPIALGLNLDIALHLFWMGIGTYLYARLEAGMRWQGALLTALIFSLSPMWLAHISGGHIPMLAAIAWWPWVWLSWNRYLSKSNTGWMVVAGVGFTSQFMNHGMIFALSLLAIAIFTIFRLFQRRNPIVLRLVKGWAISISVTLLLSAVQLLPFLELLPYSTRVTITAQDTQFGSLPVALILNTLLPPELKFPEWYLYPGVGALVLTLSAVGRRWLRREQYAAIALFGSLIMALGANTPLYALFQAIIPGFSIFRVPSRWWLFALFAFALLSGWAVDRWHDSQTDPSRKMKTLLYGIGVLYGLIAAISIISDSSIPYDVFPTAILLILMVAILLTGPYTKLKFISTLALVFIDLAWTGNTLIRPHSPFELQQPSALMRTLERAAQNDERSFAPYGGLEMAKLAAFDLQAADGYDSFALHGYAQAISSASGCDYDGYSATAPPMGASPSAAAACPIFKPAPQLLALFNIRYILLPDHTYNPYAMSDSRSDGLWIYEQPKGFGRAFSVARGKIISPDACPRILREHDLATTGLVETQLPFVRAGEPHQVIREQSTGNTETFRVIADEAGLLIRSESWAPGWKASIDGKETPVHRVDCTLQGVWMDPGDHSVKFMYRPTGFIVGRNISILSSIGLLVWLTLCVVMGRLRGEDGQIKFPNRSDAS